MVLLLALLLVARVATAHDVPIEPSVSAFGTIEVMPDRLSHLSAVPPNANDRFDIVWDASANGAQFDLAAEQCGRTRLPEIEEPVKLDALLKARDPARALYFADENGGEPAAQAFQPGPALILIGPEGGFTPDEAVVVRATPNSIAISLGPRILRAETAALAAVAAWMSVAGDWR